MVLGSLQHLSGDDPALNKLCLTTSTTAKGLNERVKEAENAI